MVTNVTDTDLSQFGGKVANDMESDKFSRKSNTA